MTMLHKQRKYEENKLKQKIASPYFRSKTHDIPLEAQLKIAQILIFIMKETIKVSNVTGIMVPLLIHSKKQF